MAAKPKQKLHRTKIDMRDREALMAHDPAPHDVLEQALEIKERALTNLGLGASAVTSILYTQCYYHIPTTAIPTMAVTISGDGVAMLMYNPHFTVSLGVTGAEFVLFHEARHLIHRHLFAEPHLNADRRWTLATEACINHVAMTRLKRSMPEADTAVVDPKTGAVTIERQKTGVDPRELHRKYADNLKKQGLDPVDFDAFIETDFGCYAQLCRMTEDEKTEQQMASLGECVHAEDGNGSGEGGVPMDQEAVDGVGGEVLGRMIHQALNGRENAREELLDLGERTDGATERVSKIWGDLGLARLRGETVQNRRVDWWKRWLNDTLASLLQEGDRLVYPKKRGAIDLALGLDPMLMHRGHEELKTVLLAVDASGSMSNEVLDYIAKLVGYTDGVQASWVSFDGALMPFAPGERIMGGGGTNFTCVMDYAEGRLEVGEHRMDFHPDAVIMITDGYADPITPKEPEKWIWLITDGGDSGWINQQPNAIRMKNHHITMAEAVAEAGQ